MTTGDDDLVAAVRLRADAYARCSTEQALTYACEDVLETIIASRALAVGDVDDFIARVCDAEDLDPPTVSLRRRRAVVASADLDGNSICLDRGEITVATVLHELAHLACRVDSHGVMFRDTLVALCRRHAGVEHAALLHWLYTESGLEMSPWASSASHHR